MLESWDNVLIQVFFTMPGHQEVSHLGDFMQRGRVSDACAIWYNGIIEFENKMITLQPQNHEMAPI